MEAGILPIRAPARGKRRIASSLGPETATRIARALALDAIDLASTVSSLKWWLVSDDPSLIEIAAARDMDVLLDEGRGLRAAAGFALEEVRVSGASSAIVLPADLPLARPDDIVDLIDTLATSDLVLVPSGEDGGTNALGMSPPGLIDPLFGSGSLQAHIAAAEAKKVRVTILSNDRLGLDLDTVADIRAFVDMGPAPGRSYDVCSDALSVG